MMPQDTSTTNAAATIHAIDPDASTRQQIRQTFTRLDYEVLTFPSAHLFLAQLSPYASGTAPTAGCVICEVQLPGMSGLELQQALLESDPTLPIVFVSADADAPTVVQAMRYGAIDFLDKPVRPNQLLEAVYQSLALSDLWRSHLQRRQSIRQRLDQLSERERQVMDYVIQGLPSKQIAVKLFLSTRTVEHHRRIMMKKMQASNLVHLITMMHRLRTPLPRTLQAATRILCEADDPPGHPTAAITAFPPFSREAKRSAGKITRK